jgi:hypothetical protein
MNLAAENQVWATVNHQGVTAILLYKFWSIRGEGMRKQRKGAANDEKDRAETRFVSMGILPL